MDHAHDVEIPVERLEMVQTADHVDFGRAGLFGLEHALANHLVGEFVGLFRLQVGTKRAKRAAIDTNVRGVQVDVGVVVGEIAVLTLADDIGQTAEREHVDVFVEEHPLVEREPLASLHLFGDGLEGSVLDSRPFSPAGQRNHRSSY